MAPIVYEATVYEHEISYKNFKGENKVHKLYFALHPMSLLAVFSQIPTKKVKSGNPALNGKDADMTEEEQIKLVRRIAEQAAGTPSDDGESWYPFEGFTESLAGQAFMTKLVTTDQIRRDFSEKVILGPMRSFTQFFEQDPSNSAKEVAELKDMLAKFERVFKTPDPASETAEDRKARLLRELEAIGDDSPSAN